jgi:hypothetical protein
MINRYRKTEVRAHRSWRHPAGLRADLLTVESDPSTDIRNTRKAVAVWQSGILLT